MSVAIPESINNFTVYQGTITRPAPGLSRLSLDPAPIVCAICREPCQQLMHIEGFQIGRPPTHYYQVIRCLNCLFEDAYYVYFSNGQPVKIRFKNGYNHHFMREMAAYAPSRASMQWTAVPYSTVDGWSTFAGGYPRWLQSPEWPHCPQCRAKMEFILQLSSDTLDEGHLLLGDDFYIQLEYGSTLYFFFCHQCNISASVTQCT